MPPRMVLALVFAATAVIAGSCASPTSVQTGERLAVDVQAPAGDTVAEVSTPVPMRPVAGPEQLDALADDCRAGSDLACDILFQVSAFDSPEEAVALDCGGRGEPGPSGFCTDGIEVDGTDPWFDEDSAALEDIAEDCETGDMTACDFLFFRSERLSEYEVLGNGCAFRVDVAIPDCRTLFGTE